MNALRRLAVFHRKTVAPDDPASSDPASSVTASSGTASSVSSETQSDAVLGKTAAVETAAAEASVAPGASHFSPNALQAACDAGSKERVASVSTSFPAVSGSSVPPAANAVTDERQATGSNLSPVSGVRSLPRPALRWVGPAGRIAVRELDFVADGDAVCSWQRETYGLNFADFRFNDSFAAAFRHDLRRAALDPNHALFVLDDGAPIGFLWLVICENTWTGERYGYINNLYISPSQRARGLAGELMRQSEIWFKSRRIKRVRLTVTVANQAAVRLYQKQGYEETRWEMEKNL